MLIKLFNCIYSRWIFFHELQETENIYENFIENFDPINPEQENLLSSVSYNYDKHEVWLNSASRYEHSCVLFKLFDYEDMIIVSGGYNQNTHEFLDSTEVWIPALNTGWIPG